MAKKNTRKEVSKSIISETETPLVIVEVSATDKLKELLKRVQILLNSKPTQDERSILLANQTALQRNIKEIGN
jgi:hypothetical protein